MERKSNGRIRIFGIILGLILLAIASWMSVNTVYLQDTTEATYTEDWEE
jgi:hypothetical protein